MFNIFSHKEMKMKTTIVFHLTPVLLAMIMKQKTTNAGKVAVEGQPSYAHGGNVN
jgi:hypothetical protein